MKKLLLTAVSISALAVSTTAFAGNSTSTVTQINTDPTPGVGPMATVDQSGTIDGASTSVILQEGTFHDADVTQSSTAGQSATGVEVLNTSDVEQNGTSHKAKVEQISDGAPIAGSIVNDVVVIQYDTGQDVDVFQVGDGNVSMSDQSGSDNVATVNQNMMGSEADGNNSMINQSGTMSEANVTQIDGSNTSTINQTGVAPLMGGAGSGGIVNVTQSDASGFGSESLVNQSGDSNLTNVTQDGRSNSNDGMYGSVVNQTGSANDITVSQGGGDYNYVEVNQNGTDNTVAELGGNPTQNGNFNTMTVVNQDGDGGLIAGQQDGDSNTATFTQNTSTYGATQTPSAIRSLQDGDSNTISVVQGNPGQTFGSMLLPPNANANVLSGQIGNNNTASILQFVDQGAIGNQQVGDGNSSQLNQLGNDLILSNKQDSTGMMAGNVSVVNQGNIVNAAGGYVEVEQIGTNDSDVEQVATTGGAPGSFAYVFQGAAGSPATGNDSDIEQRGDDLTATVTQLGDDNISDVYQDGLTNTATVLQSGDVNFSDLDQSGMMNTASVTQSGSNNFSYLYQDLSGNTATVNQVTSGNTSNIDQTGSIGGTASVTQ